MAGDCTIIVDIYSRSVIQASAVKRKLYSTVEAARAARVPLATLQHWIKTRAIHAPAVRLVGGRAVRHWRDAQIWRIRELKGTLRPGPKGPWRKHWKGKMAQRKKVGSKAMRRRLAAMKKAYKSSEGRAAHKRAILEHWGRRNKR
jgi:hypothetical protein